ncbi:P-loop containing nucleoside triphosphate hydrolase protein [Kalaharituber pfeilii]|nr:P-loop containing nucleoside triphosphate hydrolase protein [Kalaharituber pfeilii]
MMLRFVPPNTHIIPRHSRLLHTPSTCLPIISIAPSTFYHQHPSLPLPPSSNPPLFPNLSLTLRPHVPTALLGPPLPKTTFLSLLQGKLIPSPPLALSYPSISAQHLSSSTAILLVQFASQNSRGLVSSVSGDGGYVSARYESLRTAEDVSLRKWLIDGGKMNPGDVSEGEEKVDEELLGKVVRLLRLDGGEGKEGEGGLMEQPVMTLSNGQARRAKIAQGLLKRPKMVLLDEPFMGLDPPSTTLLSHLLSRIAAPPSPSAPSTTPSELLSTTPFLALRPQDPIPSWIHNVIYLDTTPGTYRVLSLGPKDKVISELKEKHNIHINTEELGTFREGLFKKVWGGVDQFGLKKEGGAQKEDGEKGEGKVMWDSGDESKEVLVDMDKISIVYGMPPRAREVLKDFSWRIRRGDRWGVFGPNGSGKTTLLSLLTSDHPQTYSQRVTLFSHLRSTPGVSLFDIQSRIGQSSPEIHSFFPQHLSARRTVESAWAETFISRPSLPPHSPEAIGRLFTYFKPAFGGEKTSVQEIMDTIFGEMPIGLQRLVLFMRAVVKRPDLVILDEAFAGMEEGVRRACLDWIEMGDGQEGEAGIGHKQALVVVSHLEEEVPRGVSRWVRLAGTGAGGKAEFGVV